MIICSSLSDGSGAGAKARRAFTIVELLISAAIAAIILAAVFATVSTSFGILTVTRQNLRGTQIIVSRLEGLRLEAWDQTNQLSQLFNTGYLPTSFVEYFYPLGLNGSTNQGIAYYGTMTVSQLTNSTLESDVFGGTIPDYATNMALVTVSLSWTNSVNGLSAQGTAHNRSMTTLVSEFGIQNYVYTH
ncbi:MAG TPA: prepilin-type N-terminal cleavage/methylation domain-containing protein [Verrucomicrobiae bacterium]|nr:prepilin-type N-terminal cleavage/methylation domain-containing protein [Verrucomicrobiae bacterium]